jgi:ATPase subunit of ABC transporter with duplicated ATPase domains
VSVADRCCRGLPGSVSELAEDAGQFGAVGGAEAAEAAPCSVPRVARISASTVAPCSVTSARVARRWPGSARLRTRSRAWSASTRPAQHQRYAKPDATDAEIEDAARAAQIHDLIASLPDGYDTVVGSRGHRFSGGEKQRIAIARTMLRDPRVLVLDEATSALDTDTERAVQRTFDTLAWRRTIITIARRLSTVRNADRIIVLDHGRILEAGDHASLLADQGRYAQLAA